VTDTPGMSREHDVSSGKIGVIQVKGVVMTWIKKAVWLLVAAFVLFYLFTRPEQAAAAVKTFVGAFDAIVRFFTALAAR
jgi:hypothetical protein